METKNKSLFDGKHRYVSETALVCSCSYKKRFVVTCLLFNSSLAHLCRYFLLLMAAAAAALPVWRLQLKVRVSAEGRPGAGRQAPTHRYPATESAASGRRLSRNYPPPTTPSANRFLHCPPSLLEVSGMHQALAAVVRGAGVRRFADLFAQLCLQPAWECESACGRTHAAFTARRTPC